MSKVAILERTEGTETSKYLEEEKSIEISQVAASEREIAQTVQFTVRGCRTAMCSFDVRRRVWEVPPKRVKASYPKVDKR